jgi:uncharacterized protein (TIGR02246 family)
MNADEQAVATVLKTYERALNASDTDAAMELYAADGVFMPQNSPSSVGIDAVLRAYDAVFAAIKLTIAFNVAEIRQLAPDGMLARTNSAGQVTVHASGKTTPGADQELFLFKKLGGAWKIARYGFSTTNPPGGGA